MALAFLDLAGRAHWVQGKLPEDHRHRKRLVKVCGHAHVGASLGQLICVQAPALAGLQLSLCPLLRRPLWKPTLAFPKLTPSCDCQEPVIWARALPVSLTMSGQFVPWPRAAVADRFPPVDH